MSSPSTAVIKRLFALSSNRCAFPKCTVPLVDVGGKVTGRICHIKAASSCGPRFDHQQSDQERHGFENLLLLCPIHHDVVDADVDSYPVDRLLVMKVAHEARSEPVEELSDARAEEFVRVSNVSVVGGSVISSSGQTGGQVANVIANYLGGEPIGRAGWSAKLREREAELLTEAWNVFHEAFGAVWDATSPMQQVAPVEKMSEAQFDAFLEKLEIPAFEKDDLRAASDRREMYKKIDFNRRYARAQTKRIEFHNFVVKHRILLFPELKDLLTKADELFIDAMIKVEMGAEDEDRSWRVEAFRIVQQAEAMISRIEQLIYDRLHG
jgi:hypothetical protein